MKKIMVLLICAILTLTSSCGLLNRSDPWPETGLGAMLPEPPGVIDIGWDDDDSFKADAEKITADDYRQYVSSCVERGFDIEAETTSGGYEAFNKDGYKLILSLYSYSKRFSIQIEAPIQMSTLRWPSGIAGEMVPKPDSNTGNTNWEYDDRFMIYVGDTTREQFEQYIERCSEAGFNVDYQRGDDYYRAQNAEGYRLSIEYEGFGTMAVKLEKPEEEEPTDAPATSAPTAAPTAIPTDVPAATATPQKENVDYTIGDALITVFQDSINTNWIKVAIPLTNTGNVNLYLSSGSIDIEDSSGSLVKTLKLVSVYPQIIAPGETAYFYDETTYSESVTEGLRAVPHVKAEKAKVDLIRLEVSETKLSEDKYFGTEVIGRVKNTTDKAQSLVYIIANFYDKDGKLIAQESTLLSDELAAGDKVGFETSAVTVHFNAADVASFDVIAYPFQYQW